MQVQNAENIFSRMCKVKTRVKVEEGDVCQIKLG